MKELYDISVFFLRCLRDLEKWSWLGKIGKNEGKLAKIAVLKPASIHYSHIRIQHTGDGQHSTAHDKGKGVV